MARISRMPEPNVADIDVAHLAAPPSVVSPDDEAAQQMMTSVQILLSEDQDRRLEALATKRHESKGKLIRRALDLLLRTESADEEPLST